MALVKAVAKQDLDVVNRAFDPKLKPSKTNPVSIPVKAGETFEIPEEDVAFNVDAKNIEDPKPAPAE